MLEVSCFKTSYQATDKMVKYSKMVWRYYMEEKKTNYVIVLKKEELKEIIKSSNISNNIIKKENLKK